VIINLFKINILQFLLGYQPVNTTSVFWPLFGAFLAFLSLKPMQNEVLCTRALVECEICSLARTKIRAFRRDRHLARRFLDLRPWEWHLEIDAGTRFTIATTMR